MDGEKVACLILTLTSSDEEIKNNDHHHNDLCFVRWNREQTAFSVCYRRSKIRWRWEFVQQLNPLELLGDLIDCLCVCVCEFICDCAHCKMMLARAQQIPPSVCLSLLLAFAYLLPWIFPSFHLCSTDNRHTSPAREFQMQMINSSACVRVSCRSFVSIGCRYTKTTLKCVYSTALIRSKVQKLWSVS